MSAPTRRPRAKHPDGYAPERTRRALFDAALKLFGEQGFAATSVGEVTELAGVTKGAFYHHFESKEEVLRQIHDEFVDVELASLERVLEEFDDPADQIRELLREFLLSVEKYQANVAVFFQERRYLTGDRFQAVMEKRDRFDQLFLSVIEQGVRRGAFRDDLDPHVVSFAILGMCSWTHQWYRPEGRHSAEAIAGMFAEIVLDGLQPSSRGQVARPRTARARSK